MANENNIIPLNRNLNKSENIRLALDIGTNSIGWAVYKLNKQKKPISIAGTGVRIFSSGRKDKDYTTLNATRRQKRLQRRQRDRYLQRRTYLLYLLKKYGLFPEDKVFGKNLQALNPYELRAKGLDEKLDIHHFGRALFHINQKRGFKSNRKSGDVKEDGLINKSVKASQELMEENKSRTYGEFLWKRFQEMEQSRKNPGSQQKNWILARRAVGARTQDNYAVYSNRKMIESEFNKLWDSQSCFYEKLKDKSLKDKFFKAIFYQRNLKKPIVGNCIFTDEKRISKALPSFQKFRILKELNNLAYMNNRRQPHFITKCTKLKKRGLEFRDNIITDLFSKKAKVTFTQIEKYFKNFFPHIDDFLQFNLDSFNRDFLEGDKTGIIISKIVPEWCNWKMNIQDRFIELLEGENEEGDFMEDDDTVLKDLEKFNKIKKLNLSNDQLHHCLNIVNKLPNDHGKYSKKAIQKIMPFLEEGQLEFEAISSAGLGHHSDRKYKGKLANKLPKYQNILSDQCVKMSLKPNEEKFRIPNPTVHIAFNQLRLVVNDIIKIYGKPREVVVETARDLPLGAMTKKENEKRRKANKDKNNEAREAVLEFDQRDNRSNRFRYLLWKEQKETCLYSGQKIPKSKLYTAELEVDHILPWSKTLDDGFSNKALVYKSLNQNKSDKTPFEFFSSNRNNNWTEILERVKYLPKNKQWRFNENAMEILLKDENSFLERQLNDTRYISKYAKNYLERICDAVWTVRGQTTSIVRHLLQSGEKNRDDYRNHAIDALVVGLIDRSFVQHISNIANRVEGQNKWRLENIGKIIKKDVLPWNSFKEDVKSSISQIIVSHRKRTKKEGQLHNETAYGILSDVKDFFNPIDIIHYVDILSLAKFDKKKIEKKIISGKIRADLLQEWEQKGQISKEFLEIYHKTTGIRRVRIKEKNTVIPIKNKYGKIYKTFNGDGNYAMELFEQSNGKWDGKVVGRFKANEQSFTPIPKKRKLMISDMLFFSSKFWRVVKLSDNSITLSEHFEANVDARSREKQYKYISKTPSSLQKRESKRVDISPCGVIKITPFDLKEVKKQEKKVRRDKGVKI